MIYKKLEVPSFMISPPPINGDTFIDFPFWNRTQKGPLVAFLEFFQLYHRNFLSRRPLPSRGIVDIQMFIILTNKDKSEGLLGCYVH